MPANFRGSLLLDATPGGAGAGNTDFLVSRPFGISDVEVVASAVQAGGTMQFLRQVQGAGAFTAVSNAIACDTVGAVTRLGTLDQAQNLFDIGDVLRMTLAGVATNGRAFLSTWARPIPGNA